MSSNSRFFFVLAAVSASIGIGNLMLYPYLSYKFTGLLFVPFLTALFLLGIPLLLLEFSIGQYFNKNIVDLFASIRKWLDGIGWLMAVNAFILASAYAVILSWHIIYFFVSFGLQWKAAPREYFFNNVLQAADGFNGFLSFSLPVFIALIAAWAVVFVYIRKGFESLEKWLLFTFPLFVALMLFFILYSLRLHGAMSGVYSFLMPRWRNILNLDVWVNSFYFAVLSLGLALGIMPAIGRKNKGFALGNSFIAVSSKIIAGIAIGFIVFGMLGYLSARQKVGMESLASSDFVSVFTVLPEALPYLNNSFLLSIMFFLFFSLFALFAAVSLAYSISHVLVHKFRTRHVKAAIIVCCIGFLSGLIFIIKPGFYIMDIVMHFIAYNILIALLLEAIAIGWIFDSEKLAQFINLNSILKIGRLWKFFIRYPVPLALFSLLLLQLRTDFLLGYKDYPWWAILIFGGGVVIVPLIISFLLPQKILDRK